MLSIVIKDSGEPNVTQLTYENLWREIKDIPDAEITIQADWFVPLETTKNKYICFVEADCLVSSGYFHSQLGLIKKDPYFRKLSMLSSTTSVGNWANRFYGYRIAIDHNKVVIPIGAKRSNAVDVVQIAYVPGSIIRVSMLKKIVEDDPSLITMQDRLVAFSNAISLAFWRQGDGNRIHLNPNASYLTTEPYVNDISRLPFNVDDLIKKFERESI